MTKNFDILNKINKEKSYIVPANYFDNLAALIMLRIKNKQHIYQLPQNYFENNVAQILAKVNTPNSITVDEELQEIAPTLTKISKQNVYSIPNQYFETINYKAPKIAKFNTTKWYKYAAAAVVILTLGVGYFSLNNTNNKVNNQIAQLHQKAVSTNVSKEIVALSDTELNGIIEPVKYSETSTDEEITSNNFPFTDKIENEVKLLSDTEIEDYFNTNLVEAEHT